MKKVIGIENISYTNKNGKQVQGIRLHITELLPAPHIGEKAYSEFISGAFPNEYHLGNILTVLYEPTMAGNYRCVGVLYEDKK